jgi:hypothetical protein
MGVRHRLALGLALAALVPGCAAGSWLRLGRAVPGTPAADVAWGNDLAAHDQPAAARDVYQRVVREHPKDPAAGDAVWGLALLLVDGESPLCDYRAALAAFDRLVADYPRNEHVAEARAWRSALRQTQRLEAEVGRLRTDLDRLKQLDMEMERR